MLNIDYCREPTTWPANNRLPTNNGLPMGSTVKTCYAANNTLCTGLTGISFPKEKWQIASLSFQEVIKIWKQTWGSNVSRLLHDILICQCLNYLPQPSASANNWSARHWQITIFVQPPIVNYAQELIKIYFKPPEPACFHLPSKLH